MQGYFEIILLVSSLIMISFIIVCVIKQPLKKIHRAFLAFLVVMLMFVLLYLGELFITDLNMKLLMARLQYIPILFMPVLLLIFIGYYLGDPLPLPAYLFLGIIPLCLLSYIFIVPEPNAFFGAASVIDYGLISVVDYDYGFLYQYLYLVYTYTLFLVMFLWLFKRYINAPLIIKKQIATLFIALLIPLFLHVLYALNITLLPYFNYSTGTFGISALILYVAMRRYRFLSFLPISKEVLLDYLDTGIIMIDDAGIIIELNRFAKTVLNLKGHQVGMSIYDVQTVLIPDHIEPYGKDHETLLYINNDQKESIYNAKIQFLKSSFDETLGVLISFKDNTDFMTLYEEYKYLATYDFLTGALSRKVFIDQTNELLQNYLTQTLYIGIDIDYFKGINDTYGHKIGDLVLIDLVKSLKSVLPINASLGRIGGDEFGISMTVKGNIDTIIKAINTAPPSDPSLPKYTISIGYAVGDENNHAIDQLMHHADIMMYENKKRKSDR